MKIIPHVMLTIGFLAFALPAEARRGCCSHHGGVCSNQCCDGSELSLKCGGGAEAKEKVAKPKPKAEPKSNAQQIEKKAS